jgi:threonine aldolase
LTTDLGVDVLSFGGTKNGLVLGEAVIFLRPGLGDSFRFTRKQLGQLASKMRFLAVQFDALLDGDLWRSNAAHANAMAGRLADAIAAIDGAEIAFPVQANGVFVSLPARAIERLRGALPAALPFYVWDEAAGTIRLMCSWDTTEDDVDGLASALAEAL